MNRKIKKLVNNPVGFFLDSKFIRGRKSSFESDVTIGFIIIGHNDENVCVTKNSIDKSFDAYRKNKEINKCVIISNFNKCSSIDDDVSNAVQKLNVEFIKILYEGEVIDIKFVSEFMYNKNISSSVDLVMNSYCSDFDSKKTDALLDNVKLANGLVYFDSNGYFVPLLSNVIFNSRLLSVINYFSGCNDISSSFFTCLSIIESFYRPINYCISKNLCVASVNSMSNSENILEMIKDEFLFIDFLMRVESFLLSGKHDRVIVNSCFYFLHNIFLTLLKNKKSDDLLSDNAKKTILEYIFIIVGIVGKNIVHSFVSSNYNHIHKIGYSKILSTNAICDMSYIEDVDTENKRIKIKTVSHSGTMHYIEIQSRKIMPVTVKVKKLTLFDYDFAYEFYSWIKYNSANDRVSLSGGLKKYILLGGKKLESFQVKQAISIYNNKLKVSSELPLKVKLLRRVSQYNKVKNYYKNAWVFIDNELRADDNAEHFYRYVKKNHKSINSFFLINKTSKDWVRLKNEGFRLIEFGSVAHRLALINSKILLSSHANPAITNYLPRKHFSDLMNYKFVFLQHGITKDDQSEWLNSRKIDYLVTAAKPEYHDMAGPGRYRYTSIETILTGFPRYDNLISTKADKRQILIMPTWRKNLAGELGSRSSKRLKNEHFIDSAFCSMWSGFINSERLRVLAEQNNFEIVFFPHPNLVDYLDDLNIPDYVKLGDLHAGSMQNVFRECDILITDFSSVAFDIAYMTKPVIYFQFDADTFFSQHSYSKGYYDYEKNGFGPVVNTVDNLNLEIEKISGNSYVVTDFYERRINDFFAFRDTNNSERLFRAITQKQTNETDFYTTLCYLSHYVNSYNVAAASKLLDDNLSKFMKIDRLYYTTVIDVLNKLSFLSCFHEKNALLDMLKTIADINNLVIPCLQFYDDEEEKIDNFPPYYKEDPWSCLLSIFSGDLHKMHTLQLPMNISFLYETNNKLSKQIVNFIHMILNHQNELFSNNVEMVNSKSFSIQLKDLPQNFTYIYIIDLIRAGKSIDACKLIGTLDGLTPENVESLLEDIHAHADESNIKKLDLSKIKAMPSHNTKLISTYFTFAKSIPFVEYKKFIDEGIVLPVIIDEYISRLYKSKKYNLINEFLLNQPNYIDMFLCNVSNNFIFLCSLFKGQKIDSFILWAKLLSNESDLASAIDKLFIINHSLDLIDLTDLFSMIEMIIKNNNYVFNSDAVCKYIIFFHVNGRAGLAKKLSTLAFVHGDITKEIFFRLQKNLASVSNK